MSRYRLNVENNYSLVIASARFEDAGVVVCWHVLINQKPSGFKREE